nr:hypothetical protein [Tanacetum cinerariifolium]
NSYVYDPNPNYFDYPPDSYHPPHPTYETYSYNSSGNDSQFDYDCQPQFPLNFELEPGYKENYTSYPYYSSSLPQQYLCCARCGGPHETCQCDQLIFDEPYFSRHSSTSSRIKYPRDGGSEAAWAYLSTHPSKRLHSFCFDDNDEDYTSAITLNEPIISTEEPDNSLSMGDEHLDTILAMKSNEFIKSSVEDLIPILSKSVVIPEHVCDVPSNDNSPPLDVLKDLFEDLSKSNEEFSLTNDDSFSFDKIDYVEASPLDSELGSSEVMEIVIPEVEGIEASNDNPIPFYDPIISATPLNLTPSGESDFFLEVDAFLAVEDEPTSSQLPKSYLDLEGDMLLLEAFLNDDHSFNFKTKSSSTSLNSLLEETNNFNNSLPEFTNFLNDSDSLMEEIDLFCTPEYPMLSGIVDKDYDSERDILIPKDLPSNNTLS